MAIIVEGFDNSGKSTLAASFGFDVIHPGPRPKTLMEEASYMEAQAKQARLPVVLDRVTCISTPCYSGKIEQRHHDALQELVKTQSCVIVYCRPPIEIIKDFSRHVVKGYDELKQLEWLLANAEEIVHRYDMLMATVPHMLYDYTNPDNNVVQSAYSAQLTRGAWIRSLELMKQI